MKPSEQLSSALYSLGIGSDRSQVGQEVAVSFEEDVIPSCWHTVGSGAPIWHVQYLGHSLPSSAHLSSWCRVLCPAWRCRCGPGSHSLDLAAFPTFGHQLTGHQDLSKAEQIRVQWNSN